MGEIAGPNDEQLRKCQVSPHHGQSEEQIAQIMEHLFTADLRQRGAALAPAEEQNRKCQCTQHLADTNQNRKHG